MDHQAHRQDLISRVRSSSLPDAERERWMGRIAESTDLPALERELKAVLGGGSEDRANKKVQRFGHR